MHKKLVNLVLIVLIFPLGVVSAQNSSKQIQTTQAPNAITGAFGILLGERFDRGKFASVIGEQQQNYLGHNKTKMKGTLYQVEPAVPDARFQSYSVSTTGDGYIFSIMAEYQYEVEGAKGKKAGKIKNQKTIRSNCKAAVKSLAEELESSFGKPRGKGWNGEWFSFRQVSDNSEKSLRLYANRCRTGLYSIVYTDEKVRKSTARLRP